jgi:putative oxidoreductase
MKIASLIARILLGALFVFAGANHLFNFFGKQPLPAGVAGQFLGAMINSGYMSFVGVCEVAPGLCLLFNRFVPLGLVVLAAVIVNILVVDVLMAPIGLPVGVVVVVLWCLTAWRVRSALFPLLWRRVEN